MLTFHCMYMLQIFKIVHLEECGHTKKINETMKLMYVILSQILHNLLLFFNAINYKNITRSSFHELGYFLSLAKVCLSACA